MSEDWRTLNQANWDERVAVHLAPGGYDLTSLRAGAGRLDAIVAAELGPLAGLRIVHLQCHIGTDTLALAAVPCARVVGVTARVVAEALRASEDQSEMSAATLMLPSPLARS